MPTFDVFIPHLNRWLADSVVVAHHARFDLAFLRAEYRHCGWQLPWLPTLCTLDASSYYLPLLDRRRLRDCCAAAQISLQSAHSALGDARATAALLSYYLDPRIGTPPRPEDIEVLGQVGSVVWPQYPTVEPDRSASGTGERSRRGHVRERIKINTAARAARASVPNLVELLDDFSLIDALDEGAPEGALSYLEKVAEVLEDAVLTIDEAAALDAVADAHGLGREERAAAHRAFVLALCHQALDDGLVTRSERAELTTMTQLLSLPSGLVARVLEQAEAARHERLGAGLGPLPQPWPYGEPLRVGDKVAFTGCERAQRAQLEDRATQLGVRVMSTVSRRTALLVTDGTFVGTKAAAAAECETRVVAPEIFQELLDHLQPAAPRHRAPRRQPTYTDSKATQQTLTDSSGAPSTTLSSRHGAANDVPTGDRARRRVSPAAVRQWARDNGYQVGQRGRLSQEIVDAYRVASGG